MEYTRIDKDELEEIIGMANIDPEEHKFGVNVKLHMLQPGDKKPPHYARIKVFKKLPDDGFEVTLNQDASKIQTVGKPFLKGKNLRKVMKGIKKYRIAFLMFWEDPGMTNIELRRLMDKIDKGIDLKIEN